MGSDGQQAPVQTAQPTAVARVKVHQTTVIPLIKLVTGLAVGYMAYKICSFNADQAENIRKMVQSTYQTNVFQKDFVLKEHTSFVKELCNTLIKNDYLKPACKAISFYAIHLMASGYSIKQAYDLSNLLVNSRTE